jgi:hypothetical protein
MKPACGVEECRKGAKSRGWCSAHYERWRKYGDPLGEAPKRPSRRNYCSVEQCDRVVVGFDYCHMHYQRWKRHGNVDAGRPHRHMKEGYVQVYRPDHALANARGYVPEHRLVLFDKIGPGTHSCHWCGIGLEWRGRGRAALIADHLDENKVNNDPSNLVPSCTPCNGNRARARGLCSIEGCGRPHDAHGWCRNHCYLMRRLAGASAKDAR